MDPDIEYDYLIQFMDAVRGTRQQLDEGEDETAIVLFPEISIGDAP